MAMRENSLSNEKEPGDGVGWVASLFRPRCWSMLFSLGPKLNKSVFKLNYKIQYTTLYALVPPPLIRQALRARPCKEKTCMRHRCLPLPC
jgi:hypothetical protein